MSGPRIGIPLCLDARERIRKGRRYHYIDESYAVAVREAGGAPCYLPHHDTAEESLVGLDGLLLPGGDDFVPTVPYPPEVVFDPVPDEARRFDEALFRGAISRDLPVLGICYGMQLMALTLGGRLHHHLPLDVPEADAHQLGDGPGRHELRVEPDSLLAPLLPTRARVNSLHHQALADAGSRLRVVARAPDGVIEAVQGNGAAFLLGVQWHPEKLDTTERKPLFSAFVDASRAS